VILIPMAGLSRRFAEAGYIQPKFMLPLHGRSVFEHAVGSFQAYFDDVPFAFVFREDAAVRDFAPEALRRLGVRRFELVGLEAPTRGQAETVALGLRRLGWADSPVTVFNIDTFRPGFRMPAGAQRWDGYLEVFRGEGANWSYVRPAGPDSDRVAETTEKRPVSDLCCTGLYHFSSSRRFLEAFDAYATAPPADLPGGELYVAPLYNLLIGAGGDIRWRLIQTNEVIFCGTPAEYEGLCGAPASGWAGGGE
jgi:hypothetical protein